MSTNGRSVALKILMEINEEGAYSNISLMRNLTNNIKNVDQGLIREIVYGTLENMIYIDWVINKFSKTRFNKISPVIKQILRMGIYQILFMDRIPDSAAVNESVKLAKKYSHKGAFGFVNGILRNISRNKDNIIVPDKNKNPLEYLTIKYSHPKWMIKDWVSQFGFDFTESLCIANNTKPKLNIRVNTLKTTKDELLKKLNSLGLSASETDIAKDGIIVYNPLRITETEEFKNGYFQIQDESSMLVGEIMNPEQNSLIIDVCSAPGGKSTHLAQKMNNNGKIIARDIYEHKLKLIRDNAKRLGIDIIETENFNALDVDNKYIGKADYCLVDAPCSGLGLIRRKPEIKWNKQKDNIDEITNLQYEILKNAGLYLKKNGVLVYSTCTIEKKENINLIQKFLNNHSNFKFMGFDTLIKYDDTTKTALKGYLELYPNIHNTDGFFIAKLVKL